MHSTDALRHGAYICLRIPDAVRRSLASTPVSVLVERLGLENEFHCTNGHPPQAVAFLRRVETTPADMVDDHLFDSDAVIHVAAAHADPVTAFCHGLMRLLERAADVRILRGVARPTSYTGNAMHEFAYAHQVIQQPGTDMPNAFLVPMSKTSAWWDKDWMERHTYFLPRYDEQGAMIHQGHALAAAAGIRSLMRRTYKHPTLPAPDGAYDFLNYFECSDAEVAIFREVCTALRDPVTNPEWRFVREGPTWRGRRVSSWPQLFA